MHKDSQQKWLERNRAPRVQISYDVEIGDAVQEKELPMVVGVLSDLSGMQDSNVARTPLGERRFVEIDQDTFSAVMKKVGPRLDISGLGINIENLSLSGELKFESIDDFEPEAIVRGVTGLKELLEARDELRDLMAKLDGNVKLEGRLNALLVDDGGKPLAKEARDIKLKELASGEAAKANGASSGASNGSAPAPQPQPEGDPGKPEDPKP